MGLLHASLATARGSGCGFNFIAPLPPPPPPIRSLELISAFDGRHSGSALATASAAHAVAAVRFAGFDNCLCTGLRCERETCGHQGHGQ